MRSCVNVNMCHVFIMSIRSNSPSRLKWLFLLQTMQQAAHNKKNISILNSTLKLVSRDCVNCSIFWSVISELWLVCLTVTITYVNLSDKHLTGNREMRGSIPARDEPLGELIFLNIFWFYYVLLILIVISTLFYPFRDNFRFTTCNNRSTCALPKGKSAHIARLNQTFSTNFPLLPHSFYQREY